MNESLHDKVAIVTGAGHGTGAAIAHALAGSGARVAVNDLNPDRAERTAAAIRQAGGRAVAIAADISNKFQCVHLVETTRQEWEPARYPRQQRFREARIHNSQDG